MTFCYSSNYQLITVHVFLYKRVLNFAVYSEKTTCFDNFQYSSTGILSLYANEIFNVSDKCKLIWSWFVKFLIKIQLTNRKVLRSFVCGSLFYHNNSSPFQLTTSDAVISLWLSLSLSLSCFLSVCFQIRQIIVNVLP